MLSIRRKVALQFFVSNLALIVNFVLTIILARLLSPQDIGIFSMSAVLMTIAHVFRDFGVTAFIKRERELTSENLRSAFGVLLITSWSVALIMYASAPYWALFFKETRVISVVEVLAIGFLFIPFGSIPMAILTREMDVGGSARVTAVSTAIYFCTSIGLAANDYGPMTMAWANLVNIIATGLMARWTVQQPLPWIPGFRRMRDILHFGLGNLLTALLKAADNALPDIVIGKWMTPTAVGLFSRANSTVNLVSTTLVPTINYFALPYMAKVHHANGPVAGEFLRASSLISSITLPALAVIAVLAKDIVSVLYGASWIESAPAIPWLCLACAINGFFTLSAPTLTGVGKPYAAITPNGLVLGIKIAITLSLMDGTIETFAYSIALAQIASIPLHIWIHQRHLAIHWKTWFKSILPVTGHAILVGTVAFATKGYFFIDTPSAIAILGTGSVSAVVFLVGALLLPIPLNDELKKLYTTYTSRNLNL